MVGNQPNTLDHIDKHSDMEAQVSDINVCLLGASVRAENMGVNAIAECAIEAVLHRWPRARFVILGTRPPDPPVETLRFGDRELQIPVYQFFWPSKQLVHPDAVLSLAIQWYLARVIPGRRRRDAFWRRNGRAMEAILQSDLILDSSSGDGLSEVYGMKRLIFHIVRKWLVTALGKKLVLLPQSYDPMRNPFMRLATAHIVKRSFCVFLRDKQALANIRSDRKFKINGTPQLRYVPDLAFLLKATPPAHANLPTLARSDDRVLIGINVSGLLLNSATMYRFGLKVDYRELILMLVRSFLDNEQNQVVLIPHVTGQTNESDEAACDHIREEMSEHCNGRMIDLSGKYQSTREIKYLIGCCDIVLSSRMHACIAALSQGIPSVGLAYSEKFYGVFASVGVRDCVIDLRKKTLMDVVDAVYDVFRNRGTIASKLAEVVPQVRAQVLTMFEDFNLST